MKINTAQTNIYASFVNKENNKPMTNLHFSKSIHSDSRIEAFTRYNATLKKIEIDLLNKKKKDAIEKLNTCSQLLKDGDNKAALILYAEASSVLINIIDPSDELYLFFYELGGDIYQENGNYKKAKVLYEKAIASIQNSSNDTNLHDNLMLKLAQNYILEDDFAQANEILDEAIENTQDPKTIIQILTTNFLSQDFNLKDMLGIFNLIETFKKNNGIENNFDNKLLNAIVYSGVGDFESSNNLCEHIVANSNKPDKNNQIRTIEALLLKGMNYYSLYKKDSSQENFKNSINNFSRALNIAKNINDENRTNDILLQIAKIYFAESNFEESKQQLLQITKNADVQITQAALHMLGQISIEEQDFNKAKNYFITEKEIIKANKLDEKITANNIQALITTYRSMGDFENANKFAQELQNLGNVLFDIGEFEDLLSLGKYQENKKQDLDAAQKFYEKATTSKNASSANKAIAGIYLGLVQMRNNDVVKGIKNIETSASILEKNINDGDIDKNAETLYKAYQKLGEIYYRNFSRYSEASSYFEKSLIIADNYNILDKMNNEDKARLYSRVAASYYKAQEKHYFAEESKYRKSEEYFAKYLSVLIGNKFNYSKLNDNFGENVVNNSKTSEALKVATALEMLGVVNVKTRRFQTAINCFENSLVIRRNIQGEKTIIAKDLLAIGRISMIGKANGLWDSKQIIEEAIQILKKELGENHPETLKETAFVNSYYGLNLTSLGKYLHKGSQYVLSQFGMENKWEKEIIDDFHLLYKDLNVCE